MNAAWTAADIEIVVDCDLTDDPIIAAEIVTPGGRLQVMAEVRRVGRTLIFEGLHVHGDDGMVNALGAGRLRQVLRAVLETLDVDEITIAGAVRTTGAHPGRRPGAVRIARSIRPQT